MDEFNSALGDNTQPFIEIFIKVIDFYLATPASLLVLSIIITQHCDNNKILKYSLHYLHRIGHIYKFVHIEVLLL